MADKLQEVFPTKGWLQKQQFSEKEEEKIMYVKVTRVGRVDN